MNLSAKVIFEITSLNKDVLNLIFEYLIFHISHIKFDQYVSGLFFDDREIIANLKDLNSYALFSGKDVSEKFGELICHSGWRRSREKGIWGWKKKQDNFEINIKYFFATGLHQVEVLDEQKAVIFFVTTYLLDPQQIFVYDFESKKILLIYRAWHDNKLKETKSILGYLNQMKIFIEFPAFCKPSDWDAFTVWKNMIIIFTGKEIVCFDLQNNACHPLNELSHLCDDTPLKLFSYKNTLYIISQKSVHVYE